MSRAISPTSGRPCSLAAVCRAWRPARATVYQRRPPTREAPRRRPGPPVGALVEAMRGVLAVSLVSGEGHREVWAGLRHGGVRTSMRRVLRLMGENDLLAPPRARSPRGPRSRDGTIIPEVVDSMFLRPRAGGFGTSAPIWAMSCSRSERRSVQAAPGSLIAATFNPPASAPPFPRRRDGSPQPRAAPARRNAPSYRPPACRRGSSPLTPRDAAEHDAGGRNGCGPGRIACSPPRREDATTRFRTAQPLAILAAVAVLLAACARPEPPPPSQAAAPPPAPAVIAQETRFVAVVDSVNQRTREVVVRGPSEERVTLTAGPEVRNLAQVRRGDRVAVTIAEALAVQMAPPGAGGPPLELTAGAARARPGQRPGGAAGRQLRARVRIEAVDPATGRVAFVGPSGIRRVAAPQEPEIAAFARGLRPGDEVDVTYTEGVAVRVEPANQ